MDPDKRYWHEEIGFNYRMTNIQAALGVAQLKRIDQILDKKKEVFDWYKDYLVDEANIKLNSQKNGYKNVYWMVCVEILGFDEEKRDSLMHSLKSQGIETRPYFFPISDMPMYQSNNTKIVHSVSKSGLNLPSFFDITKEEVEYICTKLKLFIL
jgi:perosamine synthetase